MIKSVFMRRSHVRLCISDQIVILMSYYTTFQVLITPLSIPEACHLHRKKLHRSNVINADKYADFMINADNKV